MNTAERRNGTREFGYPIRLGRTFDEVLDDQSETAKVQLAEFAQVVRRTACTLLQARGGAGKTRTAMRVARALDEQGVASYVVQAVAMAQDESRQDLGSSHWRRVPANDGEAHGYRHERGPLLVVIDGLNEVDRETGEAILAAVGPFTASNPHASVLVTDRLARRGNASPFWRYATLCPVPRDVVHEIVGADASDAYRLPFYLDRYGEGIAASEILRESILRYVPLADLPHLAEAAYQSYALKRKRTLDRRIATKVIGEEVWQEMLVGKAITAVGADDYVFEHHLLHDYLAGLHLAWHTELWNPDGFDVVTFRASSFDALGLALAVIETPSAVETLVQSVYDWNFYAAAYMLEEDRSGDRKISRAMETALLGALAEKRFDGVRPTVLRVEDALRVQNDPTSRSLLLAPDRDHAVAVLRAALPESRPGWFGRWWDQFARPDGTPATDEDLRSVVADTPVLGWGAANTLRRLDLNGPQLSKLREWLNGHDSASVRWRTAHVLGAHPGSTNLGSLTDALRDDTDRWVKYGSLRAVLEHVRAAEPGRRRRLVSRLVRDSGDQIAASAQLRTEATRCLDVNPLPPGNWHADVEPLLELLWDTADPDSAAQLAALAERLRERRAADVA